MFFFKSFRRDRRGMTSIEYALMAGVMSTGVALSANYLVDEMSSFVSRQGGCAMQSDEPGENGDDGVQRCVYGAGGGWTARRRSGN